MIDPEVLVRLAGIPRDRPGQRAGDGHVDDDRPRDDHVAGVPGHGGIAAQCANVDAEKKGIELRVIKGARKSLAGCGELHLHAAVSGKQES